MPIERIERQLIGTEGYADDRVLSTGLAEKIKAAALGKRLSDHEVFAELEWSFLGSVPPFNIAHGLPNTIADQLNTEAAKRFALELPFETFLSCLRNGLSHGGVVYLDDKVEPRIVRLGCFVSSAHVKIEIDLVATNVRVAVPLSFHRREICVFYGLAKRCSASFYSGGFTGLKMPAWNVARQKAQCKDYQE